MQLDESAKAAIASETDPEKIIFNFEKYSKNKVSFAKDITDDEMSDCLAMMRLVTVSYVETSQGETQTLEEAFADIEDYINRKELNENLRNNNKQRCQKRHL